MPVEPEPQTAVIDEAPETAPSSQVEEYAPFSAIVADPRWTDLKPEDKARIVDTWAKGFKEYGAAQGWAGEAFNADIDARVTALRNQVLGSDVSVPGQFARGTAKGFLSTAGGALAGGPRFVDTAFPVGSVVPDSEMKIDESTGQPISDINEAVNAAQPAVSLGPTGQILAATGGALKDAAEAVKTDPEMDKTFWLGDVPAALGSAGAFVAAGAAGGPVLTTLGGATLQMDHAYDTITKLAAQARTEGNEARAVELESKLVEQMAIQAPIGALEGVGVGGLSPARWAGPVGKAVQKGVGRVLFGAGREGAQESVQGALEDAALLYGGVDSTANPLDLNKRAREFAAGAVVGGPLEMVSATIDQNRNAEGYQVLKSYLHEQLAAIDAHPATAAKFKATARENVLSNIEDPAMRSEVRAEYDAAKAAVPVKVAAAAAKTSPATAATAAEIAAANEDAEIEAAMKRDQAAALKAQADLETEALAAEERVKTGKIPEDEDAEFAAEPYVPPVTEPAVPPIEPGTEAAIAELNRTLQPDLTPVIPVEPPGTKFLVPPAEVEDPSGALYTVNGTRADGTEKKQWVKTAKSGLREGDPYDPGMPENVVDAENKSTLPDEYTVSFVSEVLGPKDIVLTKRDMTPDEIVAKKEKLAQENTMRAEMGMEPILIPESEVVSEAVPAPAPALVPEPVPEPVPEVLTPEETARRQAVDSYFNDPANQPELRKQATTAIFDQQLPLEPDELISMVWQASPTRPSMVDADTIRQAIHSIARDKGDTKRDREKKLPTDSLDTPQGELGAVDQSKIQPPQEIQTPDEAIVTAEARSSVPMLIEFRATLTDANEIKALDQLEQRHSRALAGEPVGMHRPTKAEVAIKAKLRDFVVAQTTEPTAADRSAAIDKAYKAQTLNKIKPAEYREFKERIDEAETRAELHQINREVAEAGTSIPRSSLARGRVTPQQLLQVKMRYDFGEGLGPVLAKIQEHTDDPAFKAVAEMLRKLVDPKMPALLNTTLFTEGYAGRIGNGRIEINPFMPNKSIESTVLHEAWHHVTLDMVDQYLNNDSRLSQSAYAAIHNLELLRQQALKFAPSEIRKAQHIRGGPEVEAKFAALDPKHWHLYGLTSLPEFVAEMAANKKFQAFLRSHQTKIPGSMGGKLATLWEHAVDILRSLFGAKPGDMLHQGLRHLMELAQESSRGTYTGPKYFGKLAAEPKTTAPKTQITGRIYDIANTPDAFTLTRRFGKLSEPDIQEQPDLGSALLKAGPSESQKIKLDVNMQQMIALVGPQMYTKPITEVTVKELLQNAFDASRSAGATDKKPAKIKINVDDVARTIGVTDQGVGMTPEIIQKAFFTIGGTFKTGDPANTSGGLGLAKMAFILGSKKIRLVTTKDGIKSIVDATSDEIRHSAFEVKTEKTNEPNGTFVEVTIPESYVNANGEDRSIYFPYRPGFLSQPLLGPVEVELNGEVLPLGVHQNQWQRDNTFHFSWGDMHVYVDPKKVKSPEFKVLSAGLHQFDLHSGDIFGYGDGPKLTHNFVLDVRPKVKTDNPAYPFNNQREGFRGTIGDDIKAMYQFFKNQAAHQQILDAKDTFEGLTPLKEVDPNINLTDAEVAQFANKPRPAVAIPERQIRSVTFGEREVITEFLNRPREVVSKQQYVDRSFVPEHGLDRAKLDMDTSNLDPNKPYLHNNTNFDVNSIPDAPTLVTQIGNTLVKYMRAFGQQVPDYVQLNDRTHSGWFGGISFDKEYRGLNMTKPFQAIWFNLGSLSEDALRSPAAAAYETLHIFNHEITHVRARSEGAEFTAELANNHARLRAYDVPVDKFEHILTKLYTKHWDTLHAINEKFQDYNTRNGPTSFKSSSTYSTEPARARSSDQGVPEIYAPGNESVQEPGRGGSGGIGETDSASSIGEILRGKPRRFAAKPQANPVIMDVLESKAKLLEQAALTREAEQKLATRKGATDLKSPDLANLIHNFYTRPDLALRGLADVLHEDGGLSEATATALERSITRAFARVAPDPGASSAGLLGALPTNPYRPKALAQDIPKANVPSATDPAVEARWKGAKLHKKSWWEKAKNSFTHGANSFRRHFAELDPETDGAAMDILRRAESIPDRAKYIAGNSIRMVTDGLGPNKYEVFNRVLILRDLQKDITRGLYDGKDLPFGYADADAVATDLNKFETAAAKSSDIVDAIAKRQKMIHAVRDELVQRKLLPEQVQDFDDYFHRQVLEYYNLQESVTPGAGRKDARVGGRGYQRKRKGSARDFNTSYIEAEFEVLSQAHSQIEMQKALLQLRSVADITPQLKAQAKNLSVEWETLIPKDHALWQPEKGNYFYKGNTLADKVLEEFLKGTGILEAKDFREALLLGGKRQQWVVPKRLAKTLENLGPTPDNMASKLVAAGTAQWKQWILLNPFHVVKYNLNNMSGDLDIVMAYDPKIMKEATDALRDANRLRRGKQNVPDIEDLRRLDIVGSGFSVKEVPDIGHIDWAKTLRGEQPNVLQRYWKNTKDFTQMREDVLRIAAYRHFLKEVSTGKRVYGASKQAEIDAVTDPKERAAKLARELIGDYGNISVAGQYIRSHLVPFYSWMEINAPRYARIMRNLPDEGRSAGKAVLTKTAMRASAFAIKATTMYMAVNLWNKALFPDEEDEMSDAERGQLHLILGRDKEGKIMSLRFQGALSDALSWFGAENLPQDIAEIRNGKSTIMEKVVDAILAPVVKLGTGFVPIIKGIAETASAITFYPDPFKPRPVRDRIEHAARTLGVASIYKWIAGKPHGSALQEAKSLLTYTTDPGEAAYFAARGLVQDYMEAQGVDKPSITPTEKSNALYYYKQALRYGDQEIAAKYLKKFYDLGGEVDGLQSSIDKSAPLEGLIWKGRDRRSEFLKSLSPEDQAVIKRAILWHDRVYRGTKNKVAQVTFPFPAQPTYGGQPLENFIDPLTRGRGPAGRLLPLSGPLSPSEFIRPEDYQLT